MSCHWIFAECLDCHEEFQYYLDGSVNRCPECGSHQFETFPEDDWEGPMKTYNVIVTFGVECELPVVAESEDEANEIAARVDPTEVIRNSDFVATSEVEVVASWEMQDED